MTIIQRSQQRPRQRPQRHEQTPEDYIALLSPEVLTNFSDDQLDHVRFLLASAIPKPSPKLVDLRFEIDMLISRFYVVLFVGKDRRQKRRSHLPSLITRIFNVWVAIALLIGSNVLISICLFIFLYLVKSALNIDLMPDGHLADHLSR